MKVPFVIWITGLPASGKSTVAKSIVALLREGTHLAVVRLESDELRAILTPNAKYTDEERDSFYRTIIELAGLMNRNGIHVVIDATGNKRVYREAARSSVNLFMEVYARCPIEVCIQRDPKGIYKKALEGSISSLPGIQESYEAPISPEVVIETDQTPPEQAGQIILKKLTQKGWI